MSVQPVAATLEHELDADLAAFVATVRKAAIKAVKVLTETGTLSATGTFGAAERVPGQNRLVSVGYAGPFAEGDGISVAVVEFDGTIVYSEGGAAGGGARYAPVLKAHPDITTVIHAHTPYLGAWAGAHRTLPLLYVPAQRWTLAREVPIYINRRQAESAFILEKIAENSYHEAILEANGGSTFWGKKGLLKTAAQILVLEEGARFQALAEPLGGTQPYGSGVLEQQWKMSGLIDKADPAVYSV